MSDLTSILEADKQLDDEAICFPLTSDDVRRLNPPDFSKTLIEVITFSQHWVDDGRWMAVYREDRKQMWGPESDRDMDAWLRHNCTTHWHHWWSANGDVLILSEADAMLFKLTWC